MYRLAVVRRSQDISVIGDVVLSTQDDERKKKAIFMS